MPDNYKKVVNLQEQEEPKPTRRPAGAKRVKKSKVEEIDQVYANEDDIEKNEMSRIERPKVREDNGIIYKQLVFVLLAIIALMFFWFLFIRNDGQNLNQETSGEKQGDWYSVKLVSDETYYGYIEDTSADPIILSNVYYNYNKLNKENTEEDNSSSIKLVKRGKESHGPNGTMELVRSQVLFMEKLGDESKIKQAILDYEQ